ncbi:hypothetical protein HQN64_13220 [Enterobacteriaceae bacterium BIT-l23]|uniref:Uncharacterized protein n=1 Tax=Jejubacter calystegiae TaxID=2579935 RepID=A0A4P8YSA9_9ENTR|nr:hypothetical protein [Jejubacter calystegiae]NUU67060.1 hypothetical protein [Enterobacteriaceae bacterium BIT-l23]QCT22814.1 hypothetical protein FEM41_24195 [Jejubacter calystegiae]
MYQIGDIVQPRTGGPKLKIVEIHDDQVVGVATNDENAEKITLKAADVTPYTEEGDFGVC